MNWFLALIVDTFTISVAAISCVWPCQNTSWIHLLFGVYSGVTFCFQWSVEKLLRQDARNQWALKTSPAMHVNSWCLMLVATKLGPQAPDVVPNRASSWMIPSFLPTRNIYKTVDWGWNISCKRSEATCRHLKHGDLKSVPWNFAKPRASIYRAGPAFLWQARLDGLLRRALLKPQQLPCWNCS